MGETGEGGKWALEDGVSAHSDDGLFWLTDEEAHLEENLSMLGFFITPKLVFVHDVTLLYMLEQSILGANLWQ